MCLDWRLNELNWTLPSISCLRPTMALRALPPTATDPSLFALFLSFC